MTRSPAAGQSAARPRPALLGPGAALLNPLSYPQKFALISVLFILPLGYVTYLLSGEIDDRIRVARLEIDGDRYLRPLRRLLEHATQGRLLAHDPARAAELEQTLATAEEDFRAV